MSNIILNAGRLSLIAIAVLAVGACNKLNEPVPYTPYSEGDVANTLAKKIAANTNYSIFNTALVRAGLNTTLDVANANFTVFAPDNTAMTASGLSLTVVNALPVASLTSLLNYHIIPGERIAAAQIPETFPNVEKKSKLDIATTAFVPSIPTTAIPIKMSIFPSRRGSAAWANNVPVTGADAITGSNGIVHRVATAIAPPTRVLLDTIARDPDFAYLVAAVIRADSGLLATSTSSLQYALAQPFANLTVFAPTNAAFQATLTGAITQALVLQGVPLATAQAQAAALASTPAVFSTPALYPVLTAAVVRGIVAYHVMGTRAFSVNFGATAANYPTLVNGSIPTHPGVGVSSTLVTGLGVGLSVKGVGNATAATAAGASPANPQVDRMAVNGVFFKINQVLLPQ